MRFLGRRRFTQVSSESTLSFNDAENSRHIVRDLIWYILPALAILFAASYITMALVWKVNPPFVAVQGQSMKPFLETGDLVFLHGVNPAQLKKGDVVAVSVPIADQQKYHLPNEVVHRIIAIADSKQAGYIFQTKGDNNSGPDVFQTPAGNVIGLMTGKLIGVGYPILFLRSRQGEIFFAVAAFIFIIYIGLGWLNRREDRQGTAELLEVVLDETKDLFARIDEIAKNTNSQRAPPWDWHHNPNQVAIAERHPDPNQLPGNEPSSTLENQPFDEIVSALATNLDVNKATHNKIDELHGAIREYGEHLKSHTRAVQGMSQAAQDLASVTSSMRDFLTNELTKPKKLDPPDDSGLEDNSKQPIDANPKISDEILRPIKVPDKTIIQSPVAPTFLPPVPSIESDMFQAEQNSRIIKSIELDLVRFELLSQTRTNHLNAQFVSFSAISSHLVWASLTALKLVWQNSRLFPVSPRNTDLIVDVEKPIGHVFEIHRLQLDKLDSMSSRELSRQLNNNSHVIEPGAKTELAMIKLVDFTDTKLLLMHPNDRTNQNQIVATFGGIRRSPLPFINEHGIESLVPHPIVVLTISLDSSFTLSETDSFLSTIKNLAE